MRPPTKPNPNKRQTHTVRDEGRQSREGAPLGIRVVRADRQVVAGLVYYLQVHLRAFWGLWLVDVGGCLPSFGLIFGQFVFFFFNVGLPPGRAVDGHPLRGARAPGLRGFAGASACNVWREKQSCAYLILLILIEHIGPRPDLIDPPPLH